MSNECLVKNVVVPSGISILDGCGMGLPIATKTRSPFALTTK